MSARWALRISLSALVVGCGGAAFTSGSGEGGPSEGGTGSSGGGSSGIGASSSSGATSSGAGGSSSGAGSSGASSGSGSGGASSGGASSGAGSSSGGCMGGSCDAAPPPSPCPLQVPASGASCSQASLACEYGTNPVLGCNVLASCTQSRWVITTPSPTTNCSTTRAAGCPFTFATVPQGAACTPNGLVCGYPAGRCECATGPGVIIVVDGSAAAYWRCQAPGPSCPMPRPALGTPCAPSGLSCDYGACYVTGGSAQTCTGGVWTQSFVACPG